MRIHLITILFLLISCGHGRVNIQSYPKNAEVSIVESDGEIKKIGVTPLDIDSQKLYFSGGAIKFLFSKVGYKDEFVYLVQSTIRSDIKISTTLKEVNDVKGVLSNRKLERLSGKIAEAQKFTFSKNYKRAEAILSNVIEEFPNVSVTYDLIANIYYLTNDTSRALYYYEKAKVISPENIKRDYLINKLKRDIASSRGTQEWKFY